MIRVEIQVAGLALLLTLGRSEPAQPAPTEPEPPRVQSGVAGFQAEMAGYSWPDPQAGRGPR